MYPCSWKASSFISNVFKSPTFKIMTCSKSARMPIVARAVASMMMDMRKAPNCEVPDEIHAIGIYAVVAGDAAVARA
jgi:hypothetical protein